MTIVMESDPEFAEDEDCSMLLKELRTELQDVQKQESQVEDELKSLLDSIYGQDAAAAYTRGRQIKQQLEAIERSVYPRLDGLSSKVVGLSEHIYSCQELADKMSCTVRKLDERQMRVQKVLAMVEDVINLKTCAEGAERALEEGDLPDAVSYVKQFHGIEGPAAKASEHYDLMVDAERRLKDTVMRKVQHAVSQSNLEDVFRYCPLLGPLGLASEGAKIYEQFAQRLLHESLGQYANDSKSAAMVLLPKVFNSVAAFLQHHLPLVAHGFKQVDADLSLLRLVHRECETVAIPILRRFIKAKRLQDKCRAASSSSPSTGSGASEGNGGGPSSPQGSSSSSLLQLGELDELLDELALVIQQTESYDRYIRFLAADAKATSTTASNSQTVVLPAVSELNSAVAEVSGPYTLLEYHFMSASVSKALAIDEAPLLNKAEGGWADGRTSSCVDDSFYVIRRCAKRALMTGHAGTASAIVNYVNSTLSDELLRFLLSRVTSMSALPSATAGAAVATAVRQQWTKVKEGLEAAVDNPHLSKAVAGSITGALGGIGGALSSQEQEALQQQSLDRLIHVNNLWACSAYTTKLLQELVADVPTLYQDDPPTQQLMACLQDLTPTSKAFVQAVDEALDHVSALLKPRIRAFLNDNLGEKSKVSFEMDEAAFAQSQTLDPYAHRLVEFLATLLQPMAHRLAERHYERVQHVVADFLCKRLETLLIKKTFTQLGGLQLDRDLRCIMAFFPARSGSSSSSRPLRDRFARLTQMCMILNLDKASDLSEALRDGVLHWKLTPDEVLTVLKRRVDFSEEEIAAVSLHEERGGPPDN